MSATLFPNIENPRHFHANRGKTSCNRPAFTMVELVFIIVILGILASIAVPKMAASREDAKVAAYKQDIGTITQAVAAMAMSRSAGEVSKFSDAVAINPSLWKPYPASVALNDSALIYSNIGVNNGKANNDHEACVRLRIDTSQSTGNPVGFIKGEKYLHVRIHQGSELCRKFGTVRDSYISLNGKSVTW